MSPEVFYSNTSSNVAVVVAGALIAAGIVAHGMILREIGVALAKKFL